MEITDVVCVSVSSHLSSTQMVYPFFCVQLFDFVLLLFSFLSYYFKSSSQYSP
jgi:hypothetical protein